MHHKEQEGIMALQENLNNVRVLIHSAIRIQAEGGTVVYADPYDLVDEPHDADVVLVPMAITIIFLLKIMPA